uniref:DNA topoisomerase 6 subunit A3-like n=1 Tax=Erigeron canadensis TaxID=72917 RepID=UPI001CB91BC2|nr:DNA topoisomerase 6 subunit A3-like [Erigeron canadensis]
MKSYFHVKDLRRSVVSRRLKNLQTELTNTKKQWFVPVRDHECVTYRRGRQCMKPLNEVRHRKLLAPGQQRLSALVGILLNLKKKRLITKRGIFYKKRVIFGNQSISDRLIDDLCCMIGTTRRSLGVKATPDGFAAGSLIIRENGQLVNFEQRKFSGVPLSAYLPKFQGLNWDLAHRKYLFRLFLQLTLEIEQVP